GHPLHADFLVGQAEKLDAEVACVSDVRDGQIWEDAYGSRRNLLGGYQEIVVALHRGGPASGSRLHDGHRFRGDQDVTGPEFARFAGAPAEGLITGDGTRLSATGSDVRHGFAVERSIGDDGPCHDHVAARRAGPGLQVQVHAPAPGGPVEDATSVGQACGDVCGTVHRVAAVVDDGLRQGVLERVATLAPGVLTPAESGTVGYRAGVLVAGGDVGDCQTVELAGGVDCHRHIPIDGGAIAELAEEVVSPAVGGVARDRTRVPAARRDLGDCQTV